MTQPDISQERLKQLLRYDPKTGALRSRVARPGLNRGDPVGREHMNLDGYRLRTSRVIWFYMTGHWPAKRIAHIDGDKLNHRWKNLKELQRSSWTNRELYQLIIRTAVERKLKPGKGRLLHEIDQTVFPHDPPSVKSVVLTLPEAGRAQFIVHSRMIARSFLRPA